MWSFTFKSMIHSGFIFVYGMRYGLKFIRCVYGYIIVLAPSVEKTIVLPPSCLCTFVRTQFSINGRTFYFVPLICLSVFMPVPHCWLLWFYILLKSGTVIPPSLFLLKLVLAMLASWHFHMNLRINFLISKKKNLPGILMGILLISLSLPLKEVVGLLSGSPSVRCCLETVLRQ